MKPAVTGATGFFDRDFIETYLNRYDRSIKTSERYQKAKRGVIES